MIAEKTLRFVAACIRSPAQVGAVVPSGRALATSMAGAVPPGFAGTVVELGAGTGAITEGIAARLGETARLALVERDPALCAYLSQAYPRATVLRGEAVALPHLLNGAGIGKADLVVSSLPLLTMQPETQQAVLGAAFDVLAPAGALVQFTYGPLCPVQPNRLAAWGLRAWPADIVILNLPPARVWWFERERGRPPIPDTRGPARRAA